MSEKESDIEKKAKDDTEKTDEEKAEAGESLQKPKNLIDSLKGIKPAKVANFFIKGKSKDEETEKGTEEEEKLLEDKTKEGGPDKEQTLESKGAAILKTIRNYISK